MSIFERLQNKKPDTKAPYWEKDFRSAKKEVLDFINNETEIGNSSNLESFDAGLDGGIKSLIIKLNSLPFLYTMMGSCEGHAIDNSDVIRKHSNSPMQNLRLLPEGRARYFPGYIYLKVDGSEISQRFIEELQEITRRYPNAKVKGVRDLIGGIEIELDDPSSKVSYRTDHYMPTTEAREREKVSKEIIKELERLVDKY